MLTAGHVLTATLVIAALSLVCMGISLWQSQRPSQFGGDSYGTRAHGTRGVFDLLRELKVPVERSLLPPEVANDRPMTLVLWAPHPSLIQLEPVYLQRIARWVQAGGRVVVALPRPDLGELFSMAARRTKPEHVISLLEELGLPKVQAKLVDLDEPKADEPKADEPKADDAKTGEPEAAKDDDAQPAEAKPADAQPADGATEPDMPPDSPSEEKKETKREFDLFTIRDSTTETMPVVCGGDLGGWQTVVANLEVPIRQTQVLDTSADEPAGWLKIKAADGTEKTLVASYRAGQGEILLVGDPDLLENRLLGLADNSLLAWRLLVSPGRAIQWDEFYHGLTIRGNPLVLLRRQPFGALMAAILILIAVGIWRQAVRLGPANGVPPTSRRTLFEYIETMARLFQRGSHSQPFLLAEIRSGTLWALRSQLGLNPGQEKVETISAVLRRKRPEQAARLIEAVSEIDRALATDQDLSEKEAVLTLQRISACL